MEKNTKQKLYRFLEFSLIWIGFCFAIISISSFQWLLTGSCCRSGLFSQCGDGSGGCVCSDHTEIYSWLSASRALGIISTVFNGVALILYLVADIIYQAPYWSKVTVGSESNIKTESDKTKISFENFVWKRNGYMKHADLIRTRKIFKYTVLALVAVAVIFIIASAGTFASNNSQLMTSLNNTHPACRADSLVYGYGFIFAWLTFVFYFFGCAVILFYNIRELPEFMIDEIIKDVLDIKTVLITECYTGIGYELASDFADKGVRVLMVCSDLRQAGQTKARILKDVPEADLVIKKVDLSSLKSIQECAHDINETEPRIDIAVNIAGHWENFVEMVKLLIDNRKIRWINRGVAIR